MQDIYERNINVAVTKLNDTDFETKASLLDLNHNIRIELRIDKATRTIVAADAQMVKVPFGVCRHALSNIEKVVGLRIERGIHQRLVDALGHCTGCTHMVDLTMEAARLSANVLFGFDRFEEEWRERRTNDEEFIEQVMPFLKNSCLPFKEEDK